MQCCGNWAGHTNRPQLRQISQSETAISVWVLSIQSGVVNNSIMSEFQAAASHRNRTRNKTGETISKELVKLWFLSS